MFFAKEATKPNRVIFILIETLIILIGVIISSKYIINVIIELWFIVARVNCINYIILKKNLSVIIHLNS